MRDTARYFIIIPILFLMPLIVYLWGSAPTVLYFDSAELQTVALTGGVAHPSGYPTFILFGQLFGRILGGDPAHRITAMSSFFGAAALCLFFLVLGKFGVPVFPALAGAVAYGASFTFWWSSIHAEVYTLSIFLFLTSLWLTLHALERPCPVRVGMAGAGMGLVLTGHLIFVPAVIVMLALLAAGKPVDRVSRLKNWVILILAFLAGLTPYLYLVWADMADYPVNYLKYSVEVSSGQFGLTERTFDDPWERIPWLVTGRQYKYATYLLHPGALIRQLVRVVIFEFLYHLGPVAAPLFVLGIFQVMRKAAGKKVLLFCMFVVSALFGAGFGTGRLLHIFIMPLTIGTAVVVSFGFWYLLDRIVLSMECPRILKGGVILAVLCGIIVLPHAIRLRLDRSRVFPRHLKMEVEADLRVESLIPSFRDYREPRIYGERVLTLVPDSSLVIGRWNEIMVLYYLHYVEGRRPDIELEPYYGEHFIRLERWQDRHAVETHPFVFLGSIRGLTGGLAGLDSVRVDEGRSLYIYRRPLTER